jgi:poly-gamma-glutamate capsule biosynthesis protein CapA/YwtB (metallophosphatase superfamily)
MRHWHLIALIAVLVAAAGAVVAFSPGHTIVRGVSTFIYPPTPTPVMPVTVIFVGDIMLSRSVGDLMASSSDWIWPFRAVAPVTSTYDLAFANLETTVSVRGAKNGCGFCFRSDPRVIQGLVHAGFDVLSVANNHIWDYGPQAFVDTLDAVASAGMSPVGGGRTETDARAGIVRTIRGTRIGYLAYTDILPASAAVGPTKPGVTLWEMEHMQEDIRQLRSRADIVIMSFHTGDEYHLEHNAKQEQIYHAAIDAGVDLVIGTHPHVVQEVEQYKNGWIAYSLGNFVFDQNFSAETMRGMALTVQVLNNRITTVDPLAVAISRQYQPEIVRMHAE